MNGKLLIVFAVVAGLVTGSTATFAHHGTSDYDLTILLSLRGTVTQFQFVNPHSFLNFTVKNDQGKEEDWQGELQSKERPLEQGHRQTGRPSHRGWESR